MIKIKVGILVEREGQLLLIKELNSKTSVYSWNIIKGTYDENDKTLVSAARREAKEEAGISIEINALLNIFHLFKVSGEQILQINFIGHTKDNPKLGSADDQMILGESIVEAKFFKKNELLSLNEVDFINKRAYLATRKWLSGQAYGLEIIENL